MVKAVLSLPGHSLGGALAQLAAHDISTAAAAEGLYVRVVCYTFGAPRVGSTAREAIHSSAAVDTLHSTSNPTCACYGIEITHVTTGMQVGNHAFAREYNDLVPHTWNIINHQVELVARSENQSMHCGHSYK